MKLLRPDADVTVSHQISECEQRMMASITATSLDVALAAVETLAAEPWVLAIIFADSPEALGAAGEHVRSTLPGVETAGCTSAGIVDRDANVEAAVQITLLGGPGFTANVRHSSLDAITGREAGWAAAQAVVEMDSQYENTVLLLLVDGLVGDTNDVVRGAYEAIGAAVPIVGGCAGDDLAMVATYQLAGDQLSSHGVVGIALSSTAGLGIGTNHGWVPNGRPMAVTAAEDTSILALDDRPALDVYLAAIGQDDGQLTNSELAVLCQTRPFGLESRGTYHVRFVRGGDLERRSIEFLVAVPEGETVTLMSGDAKSVIGAAADAVQQAVAELSTNPLGILAFDCVACRGVIGDEQLPAEIAAVTGSLGDETVVSGLYTYGEIARRGGALGFHNQTMVVLAIQ